MQKPPFNPPCLMPITGNQPLYRSKYDQIYIDVKKVKRLLYKPGQTLPFYGSSVKAGFPSPAEDYAEDALDLNQYLIKHPSATFFVRASGNSMIGAGIFDKDLLIVDRSLEPVSGKVVIAAINGELTVKRFQKTSNGGLLISENPDYPPIRLSESDRVHIWGVVTNVIHNV